MSFCSDRGYAVGDLFEVICSAGMEAFLTEGMILKLVRDDGSTQPKFEYVSEYVSEDTTKYFRCGQTVWVSIDVLKKINTDKVQSADKVSQQETYTKQDIEAAFISLKWTDLDKKKLLQALKQVSDSEYKEYIRLKAKFETK